MRDQVPGSYTLIRRIKNGGLLFPASKVSATLLGYFKLFCSRRSGPTKTGFSYRARPWLGRFSGAVRQLNLKCFMSLLHQGVRVKFGEPKALAHRFTEINHFRLRKFPPWAREHDALFLEMGSYLGFRILQISSLK